MNEIEQDEGLQTREVLMAYGVAAVGMVGLVLAGTGVYELGKVVHVAETCLKPVIGLGVVAEAGLIIRAFVIGAIWRKADPQTKMQIRLK